MRLPFLLPDFTRIIWHSAEARSVWQDRIARINTAWGHIERQAVVEGCRDSCLTFFSPEQLPEAAAWAAARKLTVMPLGLTGLTTQYSSTSKAVVAGQPWQYRAALTRPELAVKWAEAWTGFGKGTNNRMIGQLLNYPDCCREFFEKVWVADQGVDTSWEQAQGTKSAEQSERIIRVPALAPEANILLRWLGVRLVPHLPCSFECATTIKDAQTFAAVGRVNGFEQEVDWIYEMLNWPVAWSALHGIAEVRTPVLTISTRTSAAGKKLVVQREGESYPDEGAQGLNFPFRIVTGKVSNSPSFKRLEKALQPDHALNGFSTAEGMKAAHDCLLSVFPEEVGTFLDLGSGNGVLLERAEALGWVPLGLESDRARAAAARVLVKHGDLMDTEVWSGQFDLVAFMPGRLLEGAPEEKAAEVRQALISRAKAVLVYAYGDWLTKYGSLGPLVAAAGLGAGDVVKTARGEGVEAALIVFTQPEVTKAHGQD